MPHASSWLVPRSSAAAEVSVCGIPWMLRRSNGAVHREFGSAHETWTFSCPCSEHSLRKDSCSEVDLESTAVEMPPDPLFGVIEEGEELPALRAGPPLDGLVDGPNIHA